MVRESRHGQMAPSTTASMCTERSMDKVVSRGLMVVHTMALSKKTIFKGMVLITGPTVGCLLVPGLTIKWRATEPSRGQMEGSMRVIMWMTKKKDKAHSTGRMAENTKADGKMENNTAMGSTRLPVAKSNKADGMKERDFIG